jgi:preprotein translocase subunit SecF
MTKQFDIVGLRRLWYGFSLSLMVLSIAAVSLWGLKLGIDFTGGSLVEVHFSESRPAATEVSDKLQADYGHVVATPLGDNSLALRLKTLSAEEHANLLKLVEDSFAGPADDKQEITEERFTSIGPTIGAELQQKAIWAIITVLLAIICYITWAFRKVTRPVTSWQYGLTAIVALFHDVFIPIGVFAVLGHFWEVEIDILFITAILTVLGFSIHDTIVVFDRIRENLIKSSEPFPVVINKSVNETLARSINTSLTTLIVLVTTLVLGGETIRYFILTLILGIVFGTYSSIFIASPLLVTWQQFINKRK